MRKTKIIGRKDRGDTALVPTPKYTPPALPKVPISPTAPPEQVDYDFSTKVAMLMQDRASEANRYPKKLSTLLFDSAVADMLMSQKRRLIMDDSFFELGDVDATIAFFRGVGFKASDKWVRNEYRAGVKGEYRRCAVVYNPHAKWWWRYSKAHK